MTLVIIALAGMGAFAQEDTAAELYGRGVHAYFANNYESAIALLTASIEKNDADPRAYFFRGLAQASLSGIEAGKEDFALGAHREIYRKGKRIYDVNAALQRIQGGLRLAVEDQRRVARLAAKLKKEKENLIKYEELQRREDIVLFKPDQPVVQVDLKLPEIKLAGQDPFVSGEAFTGGQQVQAATVEQPQVKTPTVMDDARDPFNQPTQPADTEPADDATNPFGDMAKPRNPFAPLTPEAPSESPKKPPAEITNPFGDNMIKVDPDDPVFDEDVRPELPPGMNVGGTIMDLLGKTLSGEASESADRDPFSDDEPSPPKKEPPAAEGDAQPKSDTKPKADVNPFD
jgi:hypothetical protein